MNAQEIKAAVANGKTVYYGNNTYKVICDKYNQWMILCTTNNHAIGLTWQDGVTLNGEESKFFVEEQESKLRKFKIDGKDYTGEQIIELLDDDTVLYNSVTT